MLLNEVLCKRGKLGGLMEARSRLVGLPPLAFQKEWDNGSYDASIAIAILAFSLLNSAVIF